jgi:hypothetical protein
MGWGALIYHAKQMGSRREIVKMEESVKRGELIAQSCNNLEIIHDSILYTDLGYSFEAKNNRPGCIAKRISYMIPAIRKKAFNVYLCFFYFGLCSQFFIAYNFSINVLIVLSVFCETPSSIIPGVQN